MDSSQMGEYGLIQSLPDEIRVALNRVIDTRTDFISSQSGADREKEDRTHDAYHAADRDCRVLIARHLLRMRACIETIAGTFGCEDATDLDDIAKTAIGNMGALRMLQEEQSDNLAELTEAQQALVLLANQMESHSVPFVPDAEGATVKARSDLARLARLEANGLEAAMSAFRNRATDV